MGPQDAAQGDTPKLAARSSYSRLRRRGHGIYGEADDTARITAVTGAKD
jgi:hypothetical protein